MQVTTHHNDNGRTGANLAETTLSPSNVRKEMFGKLFEHPVVGAIYAQPLYLPDVVINNEAQNVVYVCTMHNMVYALNADGPTGAPGDERIGEFWHKQLVSPVNLSEHPALVALGMPISLPDPAIGTGKDYKDIVWEVGIVGTPIIDEKRLALFVVTHSRAYPYSEYRHHIWKLALDSGEILAGPTLFEARLPNGREFHSEWQLQRPGLAAGFDHVFVGFAGFEDAHGYHGWIFSFDAETLKQERFFCTTPSGQDVDDTTNDVRGMGGIWQAGQAPVIDGNSSLYFLTGNGKFVPSGHGFPTDLGSSAVRLSDQLEVEDFFTPHNYRKLSDQDWDLGSGGLMWIPNTDLLVGGGKEGKLYVLNRTNLGGFAGEHAPERVVQEIWAVANPNSENRNSDPKSTRHIHGGPIYWDSEKLSLLYVWPENNQLRAYRFDRQTNRLDVNPIRQSVVSEPEGLPGGSAGMPGGFLALSANGARDGVVWANHPWTGDANQKVTPGVLRAFDAEDIRLELWNSRQMPERDDFGNFSKFCPPTVADGRVFMAVMGGIQQKVVLPDTCREYPALCSAGDLGLALVWTGSDQQLNLRNTQSGLTFGPRIIIPNEKSEHAPACASSEQRPITIIAWTGTDSDHKINLISSSNLVSWLPSTKRVLDERSDHGPALAWSNRRVYLAWTGTHNKQINIRWSDDGLNWPGRNKIVLADTSDLAPALAFGNGLLYLSWIGRGNGHPNVIEIKETATGIDLGNKVVIQNETSDWPSAMVAYDFSHAATIVWRGSGNNYINEIVSEGGDAVEFVASPSYKRIHMYEEAESALALARGAGIGRLFIAWKGTDADNKLNVAVLNRGSLAVYGLLSP
jgi:hypothetical protein